MDIFVLRSVKKPAKTKFSFKKDRDNSFIGKLVLTIAALALLLTIPASVMAQSDASLSNLTLSVGALDPTFAPNTTNYAVSVPNATTSITVTPTTTDANATVTVNSNPATTPVTLNPVSTTISVLVTAQDGTPQTYTITVTRLSNVATLSALTLSTGTLSPTFAPGTTGYTVSVPNVTTSITVTPTTTDANATVTVNGNPATTPITLNPVSTTISVLVTAQDGTPQTYTITVTRLSNVATLSALTLSTGTLSPTFAPGTTGYTVSVPNVTTSITVTPTTTDANATVTVNGNPATTPVTLNPVSTTISVLVTAQDGTPQTYTITVTRLSNVATLSALTLSTGTLSPTFAPGTTGYTVSVPNVTTSITVTPTTTDANATVTVNGNPATTPVTLNPVSTTISVLVTAQDGTPQTYTITVTRLSNVATLSVLTLSTGTLSPAFAPNTTGYTVNVPNATTSITVTPTTTDANATVTVNGNPVTTPVILGATTTTINVLVTAQDGTTRTYTVTVTRLSNVATLSALTLSTGTLSPAFAPNTTGYTVSVPNATTSITFTPTTTDPNATVTVNGNPATTPVTLGATTTTITVLVTAQDGTTRTYTVTVTRLSNVATLSNLTLSTGSLNPNFSSAITTYTANVTNLIASVTVTPTATDPTATITVNGTLVASGTASGPLNLLVGPISLGLNTATIVVTSGDGSTTNTYTINISRAASSNATLSNLVLSTGTLTPAFASATTAYTASVPNATSSITVTPTTSDANSTITVNSNTVTSGSASAAIPLTVGPNTITIVVKAQDGTTTSTYTVTVTRAPSVDATLSNLVLSTGTLTPAFAGGTTSYTAAVGNTTTSITVAPTTNDANATVTVNNNAVTSGSASAAIPLNVGANIITTVVTAQDGTTTGTYTVIVTRAASATATLSNLSINSGTLTPVFASGTTSYTASVTNITTGITVTPVVTDATATVTVNGTVVASGSASGIIPINVGQNTITAVVTAQDGTTTNTYTVIVTRAPSSIATLSNLTVSTGTLTPAFVSGTTNYTVSVPNTTTSITVTPTASDLNATISVNSAAVASGIASAALPLNVGNNTVTVIVTAQDGTTTGTYTVTVTRAPSAIATLSNLTISAGTLTPGFNTATTGYTASVSNATTSISVTPTTTDATATVTVNGTVVASGTASAAIPLNVGNNIITTIVTAQDGTTAGTYTIVINRAQSSVATLSNLALSSGTLAPVFDSNTTSYAADVPNTVASITITPTANDPTATITVNGTAVASGSASGQIPLQVGSNVITVLVTAQDGVTTNTYTVTVSRAPSSIVTLSNLTISSGTLAPVFASGSLSYVASVDNTVAGVTVTPTATDATATLSVNGTAVASGTPSNQIPLNIGLNTITILVTAQDGITTTTYTITVNRAASSVATLSNLALSSGTLTPSFTSVTTNYTANVINTVTGITVTPTTTDVSATVTVNGTAVTNGIPSNNIPLAVGANTITVIVTAQDGTTTDTYAVVVTRAPSSIATLDNLTLSSGSLAPTFAAGTTAYTSGVSNTTTSITVTPITTDPNSTVKIKGTTVASGSASTSIPLVVGPNTITVVVTAQDGTTTNTYTVVVTRTGSSVATLSNLTISSGTLAPNFVSTVTGYAASVSNATSSITVTPTATDPTSVITVNGVVVASGSASGSIPLQVGTNNITVIVTAQDGTNVTYTITVSRTPVAVVTLTNLTISSGSLAPVFDPNTFSYASAVANTTTSLTVTATTSDPTNTITINGIAVGSGTPSGPIDLQVGSNLITVVVSAGAISTTYTISVARAGTSIATLTNLTLSSGTLKPAFVTATTSYTADVDNSVDAITVTATTSDAGATIKVNGVVANNGLPSQEIDLVLGANTITVDVLAQDGITTKTYTVTVNRGVPQNDVVANNILSPNGDGKNDTWFVKNISLFPNNVVTVFDHSGRTIYTKKGYNNDWNGYYNGAPLSEDTYYYVIDLGPGERKIKGFITVLKNR